MVSFFVGLVNNLDVVVKELLDVDELLEDTYMLGRLLLFRLNHYHVE